LHAASSLLANFPEQPADTLNGHDFEAVRAGIFLNIANRTSERPASYHRFMRAAGLHLLLCLGASCTPVHLRSSVFPTTASLPPAKTPVQLSATRDPSNGKELGVAEAHGFMSDVTLAALVAEFSSRVASMGGNYGRIDDLATKDEWIRESYTYECGSDETSTETQYVTQMNPDGTMTTTVLSVPVTRYVPKTCIGERQVEVVTLSVVGRAFRTTEEER
jgi:hypothetical protein